MPSNTVPYQRFGQVAVFWGIELARSKDEINRFQRKYTLDILEQTSLMGSKPIETPMDPNAKLCVDQGELQPSLDGYQR